MLGCIQPMSSPMMKRMFGFCDGCCAFAGAIVTHAAANDPIKPSKIFLSVMIEPFPLCVQKCKCRPMPVHAGRCGLAVCNPKLFAGFENCRLAEGAVKAA